MIDFAALAARLLQQSRSLLAEWYPQGKLVGHEYKIGDVFGAEGDSLSINVNSGQWSDFATGDKGGDLISLYAAREGLTQGDAAKKLAGDSTIVSRISTTPPAKQTEPESWVAIMPVPGDAGAPSNEYWRKGPKNAAGEQEWLKLRYIARWAYLDSEGRTLGYAVRFEWHEGEKLCKDIVPQTYCTNAKREKRWRWKSFPGKRPLYGLDQLSARLDAPVMIVEGEKKVEALKSIAPQYVGIAWPGGAAAWQKADWTPIKGRIVTCWPDADKQVIRTERQAQQFKRALGDLIPADHQPGIKAMWEIGHHLLKLCPTVKVIIPDDATLPDGWDCADAVAGGWDWQRLKKWASSRVFTLTEGGNNNASDAQQRSAGRRDARPEDRADDAHRDDARQDGRSDHAQGADRVPLERSSDAADQAQSLSELPRDAAAPGGAQVARDQQSVGDPAGHDRTRARAEGGSRSGDEQSVAQREPDEPGERSSADGAIPPRGVSERATQVQRPGDVHVAADRSQQSAAGERPAQATSQVGRWLAWNLERNGNGLPLTNLNNAVRVLESDPALRGLVWFDEFLQRLITGEPAREWSDVDDINLVLYMQREIGLSKMGIDSVRQAVVAMAKRHARNCVKEYIESTAWDKQPRIESFMHTVFRCEDTDYTRAASRNFWISMLARVYQPGCKVDNMIVLEGTQGLMKSSALNAIADPWFAEQHEAATNAKAFAEVLQAKLLTEISEMDSFDRSEVKAVKGVVSNRSDRYRASYERHAADHPRQGIMSGTCNKDDWNRDETGARRFWPIRCNGMADIEYVRAWRAQCFAEALVALRSGASWWEMPAESTTIEQRKRYDADPWITPISEYLVGRDETTVNEIAGACLKIEVKDLDRVRQMRVAGVLRALQWTNDGNAKRGGRVVKLWRSPGDAFGQVATSQKVATSFGMSVDTDKSQSVLTFQEVATSEPSGHVATERSLPEDDIPFQ